MPIVLKEFYCSIPCQFWSKVNVKTRSECWEWIGARSGNGYGQIRINNVTHNSHRIAWELIHGKIKNGLHVLHQCDNPPCVNIDHLSLGTRFENMRDAVNKNRFPDRKGSNHPQAKFTEKQVLDIRNSFQNGVSTTKLASKYKTHRNTIYGIVNRVNWSHI
jgi:hypothetical protein